MDRSHQLYMFILSITTLFTDINPKGGFSYDWFDAQSQCLGQGLTIERDKSGQPYWTGVYRRMTPWINILGCYPDSIERLQNVVKKTMIISSLRICQEMCYQENGYKFAVKMDICLCIERYKFVNPLTPSDCNYKCEDNSDNIKLGDCGGDSAYNMYEIQGVEFNSKETCLSLQCSELDTRFIPRKCSERLDKTCENWVSSFNGYASSWSLSMEQCRNSTPSTYLFGNVNLNNPHLVCVEIPHHLLVVWIGVARLIYTSIDQGLEIKEEQIGTFLECQMCAKNDCQFRRCTDLSSSSIFCKGISDNSQSQITEIFTTSQESFSVSTFMSNHSTSEEMVASTSTTGYYDTDQLQSTNDTLQMSNAIDELALKIFVPVIIVFIIVLLCAIAVVFYLRRSKMTKPDRTTKTQEESVPRQNVDPNVDCVQNNFYYVLDQCPQYISKGSDSSNESPYNNSEEGVYDHLRDKKSRKPEVEDTYQHASTDINRDMSEYDTMANAVNKKQEEDASFDYSHQDTKGNYACDLRPKNHLTDDPYDVAV